MGPVYLIDECIYFYPQNQKLVCRSQPKHDATLTQPAAKCFELLIKTDGLVSQSSLYDYAWGDNSHNVSPNTLYQNISLIRRALKHISPGADRWIITVPRKGFRFDHSIVTKLLTTEAAPPAVLPPPSPRALSVRAKLLRFLLPALSFGLCFIFAFFILPVNADFKNLTGSYEKVAEQGVCQLYVYRPLPPRQPPISPRIAQYIDCEAQPYIYITYDKFSKNISLFSCQEPLRVNSRSCASWLLGETI